MGEEGKGWEIIKEREFQFMNNFNYEVYRISSKNSASLIFQHPFAQKG